MLKGNDATLFALFKPFIFVVFFFLEPLQTNLRNDIIQMCLSIFPGMCVCVCVGVVTCKDIMDYKTNHCYYYGTVKKTLQCTSAHLRATLSLVSNALTEVVEKTSNCCPPPPLLPLRAHPTCKHTISSDVQYKPQTLPSMHPTIESRL